MSLYSRIFTTVTLFVSTALAFGSQGSPAYSPLPNEAKVLLSDGSLLVTGGESSSGATNRAYVLGTDGQTHAVQGGMHRAREGHTLTALPNGKVLVFGGTDERKGYVRLMEIFDPLTKSFADYTGNPLVPRTGHAATLLSSGLVAVIGGTSEGGALARDVQTWDFRTGQITSTDIGLQMPRQGHTAILSYDGMVLIRGGQNASGSAPVLSELMTTNPISFQTLQKGTEPSVDDLATRVEWSEPMDGTIGVDPSAYIKVRFGRLVAPNTFTSGNVVVTGPDGVSVPGTICLAEFGRLGFFIPSAALNLGSSYALTISGLTDINGDALPSFTARFQTADADDDGSADGWIPDASALSGNWNSKTGQSAAQKLPPLQAPAGVTAVAGQTLAISGRPLARVTLTIEGTSVKTDDTGRFLLEHVSAGHHILTIDGSTANRRRATYGFFETGVDVTAGITNVLNYTIWLGRLDIEHAVTIPSPTVDADTVIKTPLIPGLELHLPAGTKIISRNGRPETKLTITPVPLDKPPFPLPTGLKVPLYFTVQPGGAEIRVPGSGATMKGAQLFYPNSYHEPAGTAYNFWNYDAASKGWYVYGKGQVVKPGTQIVPNVGVFVYELTGAMVGGANGKPNIGPGPDGPSAGDPVDLASGQFIYNRTDLSLPDVIPISLHRTYITNDHYPRPFGVGATDNYDIFMVGDTFPYTYQELILPDGTSVRFNRTSAGTSYNDALYSSTALSGDWYGATLWYNSNVFNTFPVATWIIKTRTGWFYNFPDSQYKDDQVHQALLSITDPHGNRVTLTRDSNALLTRITSPSGRYISLSYDASQRISQASDSSGRSVSYNYDNGGRLSTATDVTGGVTTFTYDDSDLMTSITDPRNTTYLTNVYDSFGRVTKQTQADGGTYLFSWTPSQNSTQLWTTSGLPVNRYSATDYEGYTGLISQVSVTSPRGYVREITYDNLGRPLTETSALGQPEQQTQTYQYYADNLLKSFTDALGRTTALDYDANSNPIAVTSLAGTANATTATATYDPTWSRPTSTTDPLGHSTTYSYDNVGDLVQVQNALGKAINITYDPLGRPTTATDPLGNSTQFGYDGPELASIKDPLGHTTYRFSDNRGNLRAIVDADGNQTSFKYDSANRRTSSTDAIGDTASLAYDANGNVTTVHDKAGHQTTYVYDAMDRVTSVTDPLQRTASVVYDLDGEAVSMTDRKGQVTVRNFDGLRRITFVGYGTQSAQNGPSYQSLVSYQYDAANRLLQATDSISGSVNRTYDGLDRELTESTPQGTMTYIYDLAGRRTSAQIGAMTPVTYGYDNADRLVSITQGTSQVGLVYDDDGRRSSVTLPNGMIKTFAFDQASRLQSMSYSYNGNNVGTLTYAYDSAGFRVGVGGSLAGTALPGALLQATYDVANQLTSWNGTTLFYDSNGSMLTDVSGNQYVWDARNRLAAVSGNLAMSFGYDALGRRSSKTIANQTTSYLYDGANQMSSTSSGYTAVQLVGQLDEFFQQTDNTGAYVPLTDDLSSTLGLVNSAGQVTTTYQYDPFGNSSEAGAASGNPLQFAGRENDLTGLYYNRARYYDPQIGRFISQDPLGFTAGPDFYTYVNNNPITSRDPSGEEAIGIIVDGLTGAFYGAVGGAGGGWSGVIGGALGGGLAGAAVGLVDPSGGLFSQGMAAGLGDAAGQAAGGLMNGQSLGQALGGINPGEVAGAAFGGLLGGAGGNLFGDAAEAAGLVPESGLGLGDSLPMKFLKDIAGGTGSFMGGLLGGAAMECKH